ncbi:MAG TPA: hypothetical protein PK430_03030 [Muribaculum sp.]|jgi:hypothetical protein|uniref:Uncharacterized protein n=1 Tax=Heminiphilus faecis TaxID=2601703 RepID=A0ABV4CY21_9BACT|nr:hypothetical protein [Heminiphilus faecis]HRF68175.1 hypothetical protein [Muribaculum sp.]
MIRIGKYRFGLAPVSMAVVFVVLSVCAVIAAVVQARPEYPVPLYRLILVYEGMALVATVVYGIFIHLAFSLIEFMRTKSR